MTTKDRTPVRLTINVAGRRWFDKINGNTYHTCEVYLEDESLGVVPFSYGYDEQYLQSAIEFLIERGTIQDHHYENGFQYPPRLLVEASGFDLNYWVTDVPRRRELHLGGRHPQPAKGGEG